LFAGSDSEIEPISLQELSICSSATNQSSRSWPGWNPRRIARKYAALEIISCRPIGEIQGSFNDTEALQRAEEIDLVEAVMSAP
jgi:hypothetical protein